MKRVLYNTCVVDPWVKVAGVLKEKHSYEPVYWIGYSYDNSYHIVRDKFPEIEYQSTEEAWKAVFPQKVQAHFNDYQVDIDFIHKYSSYEIQAFTMMNRIDYDRRSFCYMERERHYNNLIKYWEACLDLYKIDVVISAVTPHRVYDYVLYLLCKERGIPFLTYQYSMTEGRIYSSKDFEVLDDRFTESYNKYLDLGNLQWDGIDKNIRKSYESVISDYSVAVPYYMKEHKANSQKSNKISYWITQYIERRLQFAKQTSHGSKKHFWKNTQTCFKKKDLSLESTYMTPFNYWVLWKRAMSFKTKLRKFYDLSTTMPNENDNYILFPLHYQPEQTTSPTGGLFVNQLLAIEMLLKYTPSDYYIYVKEHPTEFMAQFLGQTSRTIDFYKDLVNNPRVKLMPLNANPYELMKNAKAVATISGTVGWEAICNKKPVVIFGSIWYEKFNGVLRIKDGLSASKTMNFIDNYRFNEHDLLAYLYSFQENSIVAYHYDGYKEHCDVTEEESVNNLSDDIYNILGN